MMINNQLQAIAGAYAKNTTMQVKSGTKTADMGETAAAKDEILLSSEAKSFSSVLQKMQSQSDEVRADKVAAYGQQIASGSYNVSAEDVADRMIQMRY